MVYETGMSRRAVIAAVILVVGAPVVVAMAVALTVGGTAARMALWATFTAAVTWILVTLVRVARKGRDGL